MPGGNAKRVTIGMPVYNGELYVAQAIESALHQDFDDFELIISDNASTDRTEEICRTYQEADPRIIYVRHPRNIGAAKNYNYAFSIAQGEYFNWLAHDDILRPRFLSSCLRGFEAEDPSTVLVYPPFRYIDDQGHPLPDEAPACVETDARTPGRRVFQTLNTLDIVTSVFGLFRRDALSKTRLIGSYIASDYVLLVECALLGNIVRLSGDVQFERRLHAAGSQRANRTPDEVAKWFDPQAKADKRPTRRLTREYLNSIIITPSVPFSGRVSALSYLVVQRAIRKTQVQFRKRRQRWTQKVTS